MSHHSSITSQWANIRRSATIIVGHSIIIMTSSVEHELTEAEMEVVTAVFKSFETGLREATIYPKVDNDILHSSN